MSTKIFFLPSITLAVIYIALIARVTRASVLEPLGEDYVRTARAKGLPELRVLVRHGLANAAIPIVTEIGEDQTLVRAVKRAVIGDDDSTSHRPQEPDATRPSEG